MNKLKLAASLLIMLATGVVSHAQTTTTYSSRQENLQIFTPCVNNHKGETITWTGKVYEVLTTNNINGVRNGARFYASSDLVGRGNTSHRLYSMKGSNVLAFKNEDFNGNADTVQTITFAVHSNFENVYYFNTKEDILTDNGATLTTPLGPDGTTVCK